MTRIQQVHWQLETDYLGHPYYVSGNAIYHALGLELDGTIHQHLHASHGMFTPGQFGTFPKEHSQAGAQPNLGTALPDVERYADLFLFRHPTQRWLLDSRPRDALNTHDIRRQSGAPALAHKTIMQRPDTARTRHRTTHWYVNAYLHADEDEVLPLSETVLDRLQFGAKRNYGYGLARLVDTQVIDIDDLDYSRLAAAEAYHIEILTPVVLHSEYPSAGATAIPWWWGIDEADLRRRKEQVVQQREMYDLETIDHGQTVDYIGDYPIETAKSGLTRIGTHSKLGFGEIRVWPRRDSPADSPVD